MNFEAAKVICRGFAGSTEDIKWSADAVFSVGGKIFAAAGAPASGINFQRDERELGGEA